MRSTSSPACAGQRLGEGRQLTARTLLLSCNPATSCRSGGNGVAAYNLQRRARGCGQQRCKRAWRPRGSRRWPNRRRDAARGRQPAAVGNQPRQGGTARARFGFTACGFQTGSGAVWEHAAASSGQGVRVVRVPRRDSAGKPVPTRAGKRASSRMLLGRSRRFWEGTRGRGRSPGGEEAWRWC